MRPEYEYGEIEQTAIGDSSPNIRQSSLRERAVVRSARGGKASHGEILGRIGEVFGKGRSCVRDGFMVIHHSSIECKCGGCCIYADGYVCPRCGEVGV